MTHHNSFENWDNHTKSVAKRTIKKYHVLSMDKSEVGEACLKAYGEFIDTVGERPNTHYYYFKEFVLHAKGDEVALQEYRNGKELAFESMHLNATSRGPVSMQRLGRRDITKQTSHVISHISGLVDRLHAHHKNSDKSLRRRHHSER